MKQLPSILLLLACLIMLSLTIDFIHSPSKFEKEQIKTSWQDSTVRVSVTQSVQNQEKPISSVVAE